MPGCALNHRLTGGLVPTKCGPYPQSMERFKKRLITVRQGNVRPTGSWLYVWVDTADGAIAYIGATGFDPELRAHLHLTSDNPDHGRVRASVPRFQEREFDVLAFKLPDNVSRSEAKAALVGQFAEGDQKVAEIGRHQVRFPSDAKAIITT